MSYQSSFEILAEDLVPSSLVRAGVENPFLIQGYFLQVSLPPSTSPTTSVTTDVTTVFTETTNFANKTAKLSAEIIDASGTVTPCTPFKGTDSNIFPAKQSISSGETLIYGVQCLPSDATPSKSQSDATPPAQSGVGYRGTVSITLSQPTSVVFSATQRLVYYTGRGLTSVVSACVYGVPVSKVTT